MRALLDVNFLIALHDEAHVHHAAAIPNPKTLEALIGRLRDATAASSHAFWPDDISLADAARFQHGRIHSPRQLTDLYLLALAVNNDGLLASFDLRIPLNAVKGATRTHVVTP